MPEQKKPGLSPLAMLLIGYIAYGSIYVARLNFSVVASVFETSGALTRTQIGVIGSVFAFVYSLAKVPNGYMGDRFPARRIIVIGLSLAAVSNLLIGFFPFYFSIVILWGLNAFGQSMLWGPILRSFSESYSGEFCKKYLPYLASCIGVGSVLGLWLASKTVTLWGIAASFIIPGLLCLLMAGVVRLFFLNVGAQSSVQNESMFSVIIKFMRDRRFIKMIPPALSHGMVKDNINTWLVVFFVDTYFIDLSSMSVFIYIIPMLTIIGRLMFPAFRRLVGSNRLISILSFSATAVLSFVLCINGLYMWAAAACLGLIAALASLINTHLVTMFPQEEYSGSNLSFASSTMDLIIYGGAGLGSLLFGFLIDRFGYSAMFLIWGLSSLLSAVFMLRNKPNT